MEKIFPAYLQQQKNLQHFVRAENRARVEPHQTLGAMEKAVYFWALEGM